MLPFFIYAYYIYSRNGLISVFIAALHEMQMRSSDENSVRPSVCLSVCLSHACIVTKR